MLTNVTLLNLTACERSILVLFFNDLTCQQIADRLGISLETVKVHRKNILKKLGVKGKVAFRRAMRQLERDGMLLLPGASSSN